MTDDELKARLIENAIDFLERAIEEFQDRPKYPIIHFYTAVELFLKARLLHEHWSLIVFKDPERQRFENGDFISVPFEGICERLRKIVQSALPEKAQKNFDAVRKHRNKMVHFFHQAEKPSGSEIQIIAEEQLRAWYDLNELLTTQWSPIFEAYGGRFDEIEKKLRGHREYLKAKYDSLSSRIEAEKKKGVKFESCLSCEFDASRVTDLIGDLHEYHCVVCGYRQKALDYECPNCGEKDRLEEGSRYKCWNCGEEQEENDLVTNHNEFEVTKDNYFEAIVPANCSDCDGYHTIAEYKGQYLCVNCFALSEELQQCGWCNEFNNGDMDGSGYSGCSACDGAAGWRADKD